LGLYDSSQVTDVSDETHVKDFMINKYERKRYYLDPSKIVFPVTQQKPASQPAVASPSVSANPMALPRTVPINNNNSHRPPDPFSPVTTTPMPLTAPVQDNFANFDNNPIFNAATTNSTPTKKQSKYKEHSQINLRDLSSLLCLLTLFGFLWN
jgi:Arf-GAP domain and FG repeat-containing protein 1